MPISKRAADNFLSALRAIFGRMDREEIEDLHVDVGNAVAVSYNAALEPFLGHRWGKNPQRERVRVEEDLSVLRVIRAALEVAGRPGGRVFLTSDRVYYREEGHAITLLPWEWPGEDLVETVVVMMEDAKGSSD